MGAELQRVKGKKAGGEGSAFQAGEVLYLGERPAPCACATPGCLPPLYPLSGLSVSSCAGGRGWQTGEPPPGSFGNALCLMDLSPWLVPSPGPSVLLPSRQHTAAFVTARLSAQGCSPLGVGEKTPKPEQIWHNRRGWLLVGTLSVSAFPSHHVAGHGVGTC